MADQKEVFRGTIDGSGDGVAIDSKSQGSAASGNSQAALSAEDQANLLEYLQIANEIDPAPGKAQAVLACKNEDGEIEYIPLVDGRIPTTSESPGSQLSNSNNTPAVKGVDTDGASVTLVALKAIDEIDVTMSSSKQTLWKVVHVDDAVENQLFEVITGPGSLHFSKLLKNLQFTCGAIGTQAIKITGNQLTGTGTDSDMHTYVSCVQGF